MKKRIIALTLAIAMLCTVAITVSAATYGSYYYSTNYNGASVEVSESCKVSEFNSSLISDSSHTLESYANVYGWKFVNSNGVLEVRDGDVTDCAPFEADGTMFVSMSEYHVLCSISYINFVHKINGTTISSNTLYPSYS